MSATPRCPSLPLGAEISATTFGWLQDVLFTHVQDKNCNSGVADTRAVWQNEHVLQMLIISGGGGGALSYLKMVGNFCVIDPLL